MPKIIVNYLHEGEQKVRLPVTKDEDVTFVLIGMNPGEKEVVIELEGEGAEANILGLFVLSEGATKIRTTQRHAAPNTTSDLLFKSVLSGSAKFAYQGLIRIDRQAQGANAYQKNDNLLMDEESKPFDKLRVTTEPELEILANEVRCTHGATIGKLDKESLFYLMSRGLSAPVAKQVMVKGFLQEVIERVPDSEVQEEITQLIVDELKNFQFSITNFQ
jgi:Fe-S cluster assembly protein SufD